jgi:hypothetical protein
MVLRSMLGFNPDIPHGQVQLYPIAPSRFLPMRLHNVPLAGTRVSITVDAEGGVDVCDLPPGVRVVTAQPRHSPGRASAQQHDQGH